MPIFRVREAGGMVEPSQCAVMPADEHPGRPPRVVGVTVAALFVVAGIMAVSATLRWPILYAVALASEGIFAGIGLYAMRRWASSPAIAATVWSVVTVSDGIVSRLGLDYSAATVAFQLALGVIVWSAAELVLWQWISKRTVIRLNLEGRRRGFCQPPRALHCPACIAFQAFTYFSTFGCDSTQCGATSLLAIRETATAQVRTTFSMFE